MIIGVVVGVLGDRGGTSWEVVGWGKSVIKNVKMKIKLSNLNNTGYKIAVY